MTLLIVAILLISFLLIATETVTKMNKAAVAIFAGTVGWVLYICWGTDFVMSQHGSEYVDWLNGAVATSSAVKHYIAENIFLKYVGRAAEIVLFLLSTMTIVEILNNNGCFDYLSKWMRTRNTQRFLWMLSAFTFIISANLDNLTTTVMMLVMMRQMVSNRRQRVIYGSAIVIAANTGGALTVIGDANGLVLWNTGAVTASDFSLSLLLPCLIAWALPTYLLGRMLPSRMEIESQVMPYRGDETNLNLWERLLMLFVGVGGLWFIPTFHNITKLSPFLGALCVLSVLWIVNEIFNRKLNDVDKMIQRRIPRVLQYGVIQMMLFIMGIMLAIGVVQETGAIRWLSHLCDEHIHSVWALGIIAGAFSTVLDTFAMAMSFFSFHDIVPKMSEVADVYENSFVQNGIYWKVIAYATAVGGNILCVGSMSGLALMKMERLHVGWFLRHVGWKALIGALAGLVVLWLMTIVS